ncbi:MAG: Wzz/FepE/Etk N-terminal domain-containing protein [Candidatus Omnitrophica bacterium]|nr:Wzz/FepE/Etk N-terminal domain-containing protein [Candidatus Omnitrophota bacterium]MDD5774979.1 Wzz/FepE/Etk N-terminal domain-containing protein [Candidatus Omnitrophota bacterium]
MAKKTPTISGNFFCYDEIDLIEWLKLLLQRKAVIAGTAVVSICSVFVFHVLVPPVYTATSVVRIGIIGEPLLKSTALFEDLKDDRTLAAIIESLDLNVSPHALRSMVAIEDEGDHTIVQIKARYFNPGAAVRLCDIVTQKFVDKGNEVYAKAINAMNARVSALDERISDIRENMAKIKEGFAQQKNSTAKDLANFQIDAMKYEQIYRELAVQRSETIARLDGVREYDVHTSAVLEGGPVWLRIAEKAVHALALGLVLGLFIVAYQRRGAGKVLLQKRS